MIQDRFFRPGDDDENADVSLCWCVQCVCVRERFSSYDS